MTVKTKMKWVVGALAVGLIVLGFGYYDWSEGTVDSKRLPAVDAIQIHVASGNAEIEGDSVTSVKVTVVDPGPDGSPAAKVSISRDRSPVLVEVSDLPHGSRVLIEVPESSHVAVSMGAGTLSIAGVRGDIYSLLRSGSMSIAIGSGSNYRSCAGFVLAGSLEAPAFAVDKGGIWRTFHWAGPGTATLDAHVTSGEIVLK
jgi:hypothetical protein